MKNQKKRSIKTKSTESNNPNQVWICGKHPVFTALKQGRRKIYEILVTQNSLAELKNFLTKNSLQNFLPVIRLVDNFAIENLVGKQQPHQGLLVKASRLPIKNQNDLLEELYAIGEGENLPLLLLLDQVSDPHNIGAIIRSATSFGVKKIVFCEHHAPQENSTIIKSSAGTIEFADLIVVTNFSNLIEKLKKIGYWCVGLAGEGKTKLSEIGGYKNIALIVGSEGDGIRDLVKKNCDLLARIEIDKEVESLNASVAAAIALYEISRGKNV
jgi:23S rRNA (guanosine2251-2'-O)-methyltransferase